MKTVVVRKRLVGEEIDIGVGAIIALNNATTPIIKFLRIKYKEDPSCIEGDINFMFSFDGEGLLERYKYHI